MHLVVIADVGPVEMSVAVVEIVAHAHRAMINLVHHDDQKIDRSLARIQWSTLNNHNHRPFQHHNPPQPRLNIARNSMEPR
jgi:hypothetical protein